ncbi:hypothetical protein [Cyclobacterium xiamenense]|jgi:hypothetical protein|uniref:hypothetical protein n=1 Tax=Cyclobacterium xiamenense TaxID=1297121 RepID=UPI0035D06366
MKKTLAVAPLLLLVCLLHPLSGSGQNFYKEKISRDHYFQAGLGVGAMYADNSGRIRGLDVKIGPAASVTYGRKIQPQLDLRGYLGFQRSKSQDLDYFTPQVIDTWEAGGQAIGSKNNMIFLDLMPTLQLFGSENHTRRKRFNLYLGTGIGLLLNLSEETRIEGTGNTSSNHTRIVGYLPVRGGLSYKLDLYTDIAFEGTALVSFSDQLDGNEGFNRFNDYPVSGQLIFRRYINPIKGVN